MSNATATFLKPTANIKQVKQCSNPSKESTCSHDKSSLNATYLKTICSDILCTFRCLAYYILFSMQQIALLDFLYNLAFHIDQVISCKLRAD